MNSMILRTPEKLAELEEEAARKSAKANKSASSAPKKRKTTVKTAAKGNRTKPTTNKKPQKKKKNSSSSSEDRHFDMAKGCGELLDDPMTRCNTIHCNKCDRPYHLRCVDM